MARVLVGLLLLCLLLLLAAEPVHGGKATCEVCEVVAAVVWKFAGNGTSIARVIEILEKDCSKIFPLNGTMTKVCNKLAAGLVDILPWAERELKSLDWDSAQLCDVAGLCTVPCCAHPTAPEQVHISLAGFDEPSTMSVAWTTLHDTAQHTVKWGLTPGALNCSSPAGAGHSTTYTHFGWQGRLHTAVMTELIPGQQYHYAVGDASGGFSQTFSFRSLAADKGTDANPLRIATLGDMGFSESSTASIRLLTSLVEDGKIDAVIHNGDISYADGEMKHWDVFMRKIEPIASRVPYMVTPGK
jgi:hypothetical protein